MIAGAKPLGRLVHDEQPGVREQRAPDGEHLLLPAGELCSAVPLALGEAREELIDLGHRPLAFAARADHAQVLVDGQRRKQAPTLRHVPDPGLRDLV